MPKVTRQAEAARGSGLLTLHLPCPSSPLPRLDSQQAARSVKVNRNHFFADEQKPKKLPWGDGRGTAGCSCRAGSHQCSEQLPGHHWDDNRAGKWAEVGLISLCPSSRDWRDLSNPLGTISKQYLCSWGLGPSAWLTHCVSSGKPPLPLSLPMCKMEMIIPTVWGPCEGPTGLVGRKSVCQPGSTKGGREQVLEPVQLGFESSSTSSQRCDFGQVSWPLRVQVSSPGKHG